MREDDISPDAFTYSIILNGLKINNSKPELIEKVLKSIVKIIEIEEIEFDEIFFNSILDLCSRNNMFDDFKKFYGIMK